MLEIEIKSFWFSADHISETIATDYEVPTLPMVLKRQNDKIGQHILYFMHMYTHTTHTQFLWINMHSTKKFHFLGIYRKFTHFNLDTYKLQWNQKSKSCSNALMQHRLLYRLKHTFFYSWLLENKRFKSHRFLECDFQICNLWRHSKLAYNIFSKLLKLSTEGILLICLRTGFFQRQHGRCFMPVFLCIKPVYFLFSV